jgi:hypothetical protein
MTKLQETAKRLVRKHGSLKKAEAATGINYQYLHRLGTGEKTNPSDEVLARMELERRIIYVRKRKANGHVG